MYLNIVFKCYIIIINNITRDILLNVRFSILHITFEKLIVSQFKEKLDVKNKIIFSNNYYEP